MFCFCLTESHLTAGGGGWRVEMKTGNNGMIDEWTDIKLKKEMGEKMCEIEGWAGEDFDLVQWDLRLFNTMLPETLGPF